jgi:3-methyl-2-oxobutanoate hydroxymethyltransferase
MKGVKKIIMLTAYDFQTAVSLSTCNVDLLLVGDSLGTVFQGKGSTKQVTMEEMLYHTEAVVRGANKVPVIGDMPIRSYDTEEDAIRNASQFLAAGAQGVKIEGYKPGIAAALRAKGIAVMGHLGVLPQTAAEYKVVGKKKEEAIKMKTDANCLAQEGAFAIVLECVTESLARDITETLSIPTIGIGAGVFCDGQVLVINDLLGMDDTVPPKFVKRYANLQDTIRTAVLHFVNDVETNKYPDSEHTYH